jgi:hypothetical protein
VPVPDHIGREKLVRLYGRGLPLGDAVIGEAAQRTKGVSVAFIKEPMRRVAQASIARDGGPPSCPTMSARRWMTCCSPAAG